MYKEKNWQKNNKKSKKKLLGVMKAKKDPFVHMIC